MKDLIDNYQNAQKARSDWAKDNVVMEHRDHRRMLNEAVERTALALGKAMVEAAPMPSSASVDSKDNVTVTVSRAVMERFLVLHEAGLTDDEHFVTIAGDQVAADTFKAAQCIRNVLKLHALAADSVAGVPIGDGWTLEVKEPDFSHAAAVDLLKKLADRHGTQKKRGTFNRQDPTHFERAVLAISMDVGLGSEIHAEVEPSEGDDSGAAQMTAFPPPPEIVVVEVADATWGTTIKITSPSFKMEGYWDHECGSSQKPHWRSITRHDPAGEGPSDTLEVLGRNRATLGFAHSLSTLHRAIVRLIMDGDWGNDKPVQDDEVQEAAERAEDAAGWDPKP